MAQPFVYQGPGRLGMGSPRDPSAVTNMPLSDVTCSHCGTRKVPLLALKHGDTHCSRKCADAAHDVESVVIPLGPGDRSRGDPYVRRDVPAQLAILGHYTEPRQTKTARPRKRPYVDTRAPLNDDLIASDYQAGLSLQDVATKHGTSVSTVQARLKELGIPRRDVGMATKAGWARRMRATFDDAEMIARYQAGGTLTALGQQYGVATATILYHLRRNGVHVRSKTEAAQIRYTIIGATDDVLIAAYQEGWSMVKIAKDFGLASDTVRRRLVAAGIQTRRPGTVMVAVVEELRRAKISEGQRRSWERRHSEMVGVHP